MAAAMKTVEYVPLMTPTSMANANPRSTSPPNRYSASTAKKVVPAVMIVRPERLVDAEIDHLVERLTPQQPHVLAHAIEDDDRVVHRVAGNRQDRRDDVQRELVAEEVIIAKTTKMSWNVATMAPSAKVNRNRSAM